MDEVEAFDLEVRGALPPELSGLYVKNSSNPPRSDSPHWFFGDGMVHGVRLAGGKAQWYRNRFIETPNITDPRPDVLGGMGDLLRGTGLAPFADRPAGKLSGGMKQKLGLACALIHRPKVLLLDEPSSGLDPLTRRDLWHLITRVLGEGAAVLVSTPYMDEAARCGRIGLLRAGRLVAEGRPGDLTAPLIGRVLELSACLLYTSTSPRDGLLPRMPSSA